MSECVACGYNPDAVYRAPTEAELHRQRLLNCFSVHIMNSWWVSQPITVCRWLKESGVNPETILDAGCGDGRWLTGIYDAWPSVKYTGIDRLPEHIELNRENLPEHEWILGDLREMEDRSFDLVIIGGTLNPLMDATAQDAFLKKIVSMRPKYIVCLFDLNQTGTPPDGWLKGDAKTMFHVPKDECGFKQDIIVWLYTLPEYRP